MIAAQPGVGRQHEVTQRLCQRPFALDMSIHQSRGRVRHRRVPRRLHRHPTISQTLGCLCRLQLAAGELPVEFGFHQRHDVDAVDDEGAEEQVMAVDVESTHLGAAHRHLADIARPQGGASEARPHERRALEFLGSGKHRHSNILAAVDDQTR
jgi:hypothetical protein